MAPENKAWRLDKFFNNTFQRATSFVKNTNHNSPTQILKRLQREAFSDLLKIKDRLNVIEKRCIQHNSGGMSDSKTQLKGEVNIAGVFLFNHCLNNGQLNSLEQARIKTGVQTKFKFETFFREKDCLVTEVVAGQSLMHDNSVSGVPLTLGKVVYHANVNDTTSFCFSPFGGEGKDVAAITNPLQDGGLTEFSDTGPDLFRHCHGPSVSGTVKGQNLAFVIGKYFPVLNTHETDLPPGFHNTRTNTYSNTLGQLSYQPVEGVIFSLSYLNRFLRNTSSGLSQVLNWQKFGPLVFLNLKSKGFDRFDGLSSTYIQEHDATAATGFDGANFCTHSVAISSEVECKDGLRFGGWLQLDTPNKHYERGKNSLQWILGISESLDDEWSWGLSIGQSRKDFLSIQEGMDRYINSSDTRVSQMQLEAFLKFPFGKGFTLQPGLLYTLDKNGHTPGLVVRSNWNF